MIIKFRSPIVVIAVCDLSDNDHANAVDLQARLDEARLNAGSDLLTTILLGNKSDLLHSPPLQGWFLGGGRRSDNNCVI